MCEFRFNWIQVWLIKEIHSKSVFYKMQGNIMWNEIYIHRKKLTSKISPFEFWSSFFDASNSNGKVNQIIIKIKLVYPSHIAEKFAQKFHKTVHKSAAYILTMELFSSVDKTLQFERNEKKMRTKAHTHINSIHSKCLR